MSTEQPVPDPSVPPGRFVWHDLKSPDPDAARAFYTALFGWEYDVMPDEAMSGYPMIKVGETTIGGVVRLEEPGVPAHWMGYVSVDDVDATADAAAESGGQVFLPGTDIPNIGRFAIIADPSGAAVSVWRSAHGGDVEPEPAPGTIVWNELLTTDPAACGDFYTKIFDWRQESMTMPGPDGDMTYHLFKRSNDKDGSGMMQMPPDAEAPSHWLPYVGVEDVDATAAQAVELGATQYVAPRDIPDIGRFAVFADPQGAVFAIYRAAQAAGDQAAGG